MSERIVTITAYGKAELLPCERPAEPLGPQEVAGHTVSSLISSGTETYWNYLGDSFPCNPGYAAIFRVEEKGSEVTDIPIGSLAFCMGPHCSFQRAERSAVVPVPPGLSADRAVFARLMCVTMSTLSTTTARPPQLVLVTGLGPVGVLGSLIFQSCGYRVVASDPAENRRILASEAGVRDVRPAVPLDDPAVKGHVALVLECAGHEGAALEGCKVIRKGGEVVLVGTPWRRYTETTAQELTDAIFHQYAVVRSGWEWQVPMTETDFRTNSIYGNIAAAMGWIAEGRITVDTLYAEADPADCDNVYRELLDRSWPRTAAVFDWES